MLIYDVSSNQFANDVDGDKAEVLRRIDTFAAWLRDKFCNPTSPYEAASWPLKLNEAKAYSADNTAPVPMLSIEAQYRGVTLDSLVARVMTNATSLAQLEAVIAGTAGRHRDAVSLLTDEEAAAYDWRDGWPS